MSKWARSAISGSTHTRALFVLVDVGNDVEHVKDAALGRHHRVLVWRLGQDSGFLGQRGCLECVVSGSASTKVAATRQKDGECGWEGCKTWNGAREREQQS